MKKVIIVAYSFVMGIQLAWAQKPDQSLYLKKSASNYLKTLPFGDVNLGVLIMDNPNADRIILNEKSLWSGEVQDADRDNPHKYLNEIQNILLQGNNQEAQQLPQNYFVSEGRSSGFNNGADDSNGSYLTLGDLWITW